MTRNHNTTEITEEIITTFTVRKMTSSRISKFSAILVLCAALLLTKSCGILALSGDGSGQALGQAEPLLDTTTVGSVEGSGSGLGDDTTLQPEEETTEGSLTTIPEEAGSGDQDNTTESSGDDETTSAPEESSSAAPETTSAAPETSSAAPETSSAAPETSSDAPETSTSEAETTAAPETSSQEPETTTAAPEETTTSEPETSPSSEVTPTLAPTPAPFVCQSAGLFPVSGDCKRYHNCLYNPFLRRFLDIEVTCPPQTAFSSILKRCTRDVSECQDDSFQCPSVGRFAGHDDTYYYYCVASLQGGFHKFVVRCSVGQKFEATIGGCWRYDWTQIVPGQEATEISDLSAIKRELKQYKAEEKLRQKSQKQQEKLAKKQQKLEAKAAQKAAKEQAKQQAKAEKNKAKGESIESPESEE
ncbi:hypothetical protein KR026_006065 [Drosophila bipectinata]|nr:hypothetical protein KR026_006065 [Drosophila bipectinata]